MLDAFLRSLFYFIGIFYITYLVIYAVFAFLTVSLGAHRMYSNDRMQRLKNRLNHYDVPVSVIVPAYNESVTIVESIRSLLALDYRQYEIIVVDDGSIDNMAQIIIDEFDLKPANRPINHMLECQAEEAAYETVVDNVRLTLVRKKNGGKGDALNMGINACRHPYFICMDADSKLQKDSLTEIVQPVLEDDSVVAVGGMILISQCVSTKDGKAIS